MQKNIVVLFGGMSPEHDVSIISGLQLLKEIDREKYLPLPVFIDKKGNFFLLKEYKSESDFNTSKRIPVTFCKQDNIGNLMYLSFPFKKIAIDCVYTTLHGGTGEMGIIQGLLESMNLKYTSPNVESSALCMNKQISKIIVEQNNVPTVKGISLYSSEIQKNTQECINTVKNNINLPVIIKPVHLGSSIGLYICKDDIGLKKGLLSASQIDDEVLVETLLPNITEYNISVFSKGGELMFSPIERPLKEDEILSFKDKYENGAKGKMKMGGMASLSRELPAQIDETLKTIILQYAREVYTSLKCKGQVRIDFIYSQDKLYFSEMNPIPGALSYFLWEAGGESFKDQITRVIEESINSVSNIQHTLEYSTDIVQKYIKAVSSKGQ